MSVKNMSVKKNVTVLLLSVAISGCSGIGDSGNLDEKRFAIPDLKSGGSSTPTSKLRQFLSVGLDKVSHKGKGYKIGVSELGAFAYLTEYIDRMGTGLSFSSGTKTSYRPSAAHKGSTYMHASWVAALAVGKKFGIAKEAGVIPYVIARKTTSSLGRTRYSISSNTMEQVYDHAKANNLVAVNNSWGQVNETKSGYSAGMTDSHYSILSSGFRNKIKADNDANRDGAIWVWAAGNNKETDTGRYASAPGKYSYLKKYWLAAVNIGAESGKYQLAPSSATCGKAKEYCLGAIGRNSSSVDGAGKEKTLPNGGTSSSAPQIAAGLAVIKSAFTTKTNTWVRLRMLETAKHETADGKKLLDKSGREVKPDASGLSNEFGRGIMRLDLAVKPVGVSTLVTSGDKLYGSKRTSLTDTTVKPSSAFGDGFKSGMSGIKTKIFDSMGAPFNYRINTNVGLVETESNIFNYNDDTNKINEFKTDINYTNKQINPYSNAGDIKFSYKINNNLLMSYITNRHKTNTFQVDKKLNKLGVSAGMVYEQGSFLGAQLNGGFKTKSLASTSYVRAIYDTNINGFDLSGSATYGLTQTASQSSMLQLNKAFSFTSALDVKKDNWNFGIKMPLRVISAKGELTYVSHTTKGKNNNDNLHYTTKAIDLTPSGKHMIFNMGYKKGNWKTGVIYHKDKNHISDNNEKIIFTKYKINF